jgi:hypothetical protein
MPCLPSSKGIHADKRGKLLVITKNNPMNIKALIFYGLSLISLVIALIIFFRGLDVKALLFLVFGVGAVLLFRQGITETKKK